MCLQLNVCGTWEGMDIIMEINTAGFAGGFANSADSFSSRTFEKGILEFCPEELLTEVAEERLGKIERRTYYSTTCGMDRRVNVVLPARLEAGRRYPVLYMLHGIFGDENSFLNDNNNNRLLDIAANMMEQGIAEDTVIVFPNMYATSDPDLKPGFDSVAIQPYDNFINDLVTDLMPYIEREFPVLTGRNNTGLAGFSMGGRETLFIGLKRPELFANICSISAAPGLVPNKDWAMVHVGQIEEDEVRFAEDAVLPDNLIICCGTHDRVVGRFPITYHELLQKNSAPHIWYEITGADHDNNAIRSGFYNILRQMKNN